MSRKSVVNKALTDAMDMVDYLMLRLKEGQEITPGQAHDLNALLRRYVITVRN